MHVLQSAFPPLLSKSSLFYCSIIIIIIVMRSISPMILHAFFSFLSLSIRLYHFFFGPFFFCFFRGIFSKLDVSFTTSLGVD